MFQTPRNNSRVMGILANPVVPAFVSSSSGSGVTPFSPTPPVYVSPKPALRMHRKGSSSVTSVTFIGESYWRTRAPKLVSLEVASQTPSIIKRGFEYMHHKSHGYRFAGGSLYFGPVSSLSRRSQRDTPPRGFIPTCPDPDVIPPPPPAASVSRTDSKKKVIKAAPLISLEEAKQREVARRNRAPKRALDREVQIEREVAEIVRKRVQVKREEERLARLKKESQEKEALNALETRKREEEPMLTAAVAAREGGLVVAPTSWIVPLISLDEAKHTEKAKRDAVDKSKLPLPLSPPPPSSVVISVNSLMINAGNGNTTTLQLIDLEEAARRNRARRLEEDAIRSRTRMLAQAGAGLSHVPLITLTEAQKQDTLRRKNGSSQDRDKPRSPNSMSKSRKPSHPPLPSPVDRAIKTGNRDVRASPKDAAAAQEKARWIALMSDAGNWWARPNATPHCSGPAVTRAPVDLPGWV